MTLNIRPAMIALCLAAALAGGAGSSRAAPPAVRVTTETVTIPTYNYAGFTHAEHSGKYNLDYYRLDWGAYEGSGPHPEAHDYTAVVLENAWLRLTFLPELGGRLYGVTVLATGEELLYQNPVIKPTHWGPPEQGWWLAVGGVEWCLPVEEHGYEWGIPWAYSTTVSAEGATIALWDTTAADRVRARVTVTLPADRAAFAITPRLENPTPAPVGFKFWANAMLAPGAENTVGEELRFVVPIDQVTVHSRGDGYLPDAGQPMSWPVYNGTDYSRLGNWNRWLGFFARPQAAEGWAGVYAEGVHRGVARVFPHDVAAGVKGFGMGWTDKIDPALWTDDGSTYVELHGGPAPTFWDDLALAPGEALEWTETWLPLRDLPRLSLATPEAALGLKVHGADLDVGVALAAHAGDACVRLWRKADCALLWQEDGLDLAPGEGFAHRVPGVGLQPEQAVLGVFEGGRLLALSGDLACLPPVSEVAALSPVQTATDFDVEWDAAPGSPIEAFDVQVRDGDSTAPWSDWLTGTAARSAGFHGQDGHTYTFRSRARDVWGGVERWPVGAWDDTYTTVLLQPAPVLVTSAQTAGAVCVQPGDEVEFEIRLRNTGNLAAGVVLTDVIPAGLAVTAGPWISPTLPPPSLIGGTLTWSGPLDAAGPGVTIGFEARVDAIEPGEHLSSVAWIDDGVNPVLRRDASVYGCRSVYLPVIWRPS